jgi:hypothetical protein
MFNKYYFWSYFENANTIKNQVSKNIHPFDDAKGKDITILSFKRIRRTDYLKYCALGNKAGD